MARKIFIYQIIFFLILFTPKTFAHPIDDIIASNQAFSQAVIGISVKELHTGRVIYQKNQNTLLHPASTLKLITASAALDYLGTGYQFKTVLYKSSGKTYLKVGADPLFCYDDLMSLVSQYKNRNTDTIKQFVIDDTIIDKISYGTGWQWDDNASVYFPQISPYIVNRNLFMVKAVPEGKNVKLEYANEYKEKIINKLQIGEKTNIVSERDIFSAERPVVLKGSVDKSTIIYIPAISPEQLYINALAYTFLSDDVGFNTYFSYEKIPLFATQEALISHNISDVLKRILTYSDNLAAEVLIKHTGAVKTEKTGTTKDGLEAVKDYYRNNNIDINKMIIVDGSGASMNNYVNADFMTSAMIAISKSSNFNTIKNLMTDPNIGTFAGRVNELNGRIKVKTGTLANTSAVVGFLKNTSGQEIVFAIMLDNIPNGLNAKKFEDEIIRAIAK